MKYYINGKLVRTSKNTYTHAVMFDDIMLSCCGNYERATKEMGKRISEVRSRIKDYEAAIKAIDAGKSYYMTTICRRSYKAEVKHSREEYEGYIAAAQGRITRYHIAELETR